METYNIRNVYEELTSISLRYLASMLYAYGIHIDRGLETKWNANRYESLIRRFVMASSPPVAA
jgi:hypothetical protein